MISKEENILLIKMAEENQKQIETNFKSTLELSIGNYFCPKKELLILVSEKDINCSSLRGIICSHNTPPLVDTGKSFCYVFESARAKYLALTPPKCTIDESKDRNPWKGWKEKPC